MFAPERHKRILELLEESGSVLVSKLSDELGVTEETVRRDLEKLEKSEALMRTHGGAVPVSRTSYELSIEKRKKINVDVKQRLAKAACNHIMPGDTIFLDASTTTFYMAKELRGLNNLTVITNSLRVINELVACENIKVVAVGGLVSNNFSFVGALAHTTIAEKYFAGKLFFSSRGVSADAGILESNEDEKNIKTAMLGNCEQAFYLCDSTKIGKVGFTKLAKFDDIDYFITDAELDEKMCEVLAASDVTVEKI